MSSRGLETGADVGGDEFRIEAHSLLIPARYVVDLGLIRAFPTADDDLDLKDTELHYSVGDWEGRSSDDGSLNGDQSESVIDDHSHMITPPTSQGLAPATRRILTSINSRIVSFLQTRYGMIATILVLPCLIASLLSLSQQELAASAYDTPYAVDWFDRASMIEVRITTASRLMLFRVATPEISFERPQSRSRPSAQADIFCFPSYQP